MGTAFEKQIKKVEDQREKQVEALKDLKPNRKTKLTDNESDNKLDFKYVGNTKDVSFYQYIYFMKCFNEIKNNQVRFNDALKNRKSC